jgi:hypothetical protein
VKSGSASVILNSNPAQVIDVSAPSTKKKLLANINPLLLLKSKTVPLTIVPRPLTVRLDSSNALKLNAPASGNLITSATLPNTINEDDFKVKGAIIKKDVNRALNNDVLNDNAKTLEEIKKRRR